MTCGDCTLKYSCLQAKYFTDWAIFQVSSLAHLILDLLSVPIITALVVFVQSCDCPQSALSFNPRFLILCHHCHHPGHHIHLLGIYTKTFQPQGLNRTTFMDDEDAQTLLLPSLLVACDMPFLYHALYWVVCICKLKINM